MEALLTTLNNNLRSTAESLRQGGPLNQDLLKQNTSVERGELPDKTHVKLSTECMDLLEEIRYLLQPPVDTLSEHFFSFFNTKCLWTAVSLKIPDHLLSGPKSVSELAQLADADEQRLNQVLRLLVNKGIFTRQKGANTEYIYSNNTASTLLTRTHWTQWWRWTDVYGNDYYNMATGLPESVTKSGSERTAAQVYYGTDKNTNIFDYFRDINQLDRMLECIKGGGLSQAPGMTGDCDSWGEIAASSSNGDGSEILCDIGGGTGGFMASLLRKYPSLRGAVFDQENVINRIARPSFSSKEGEGGSGQFSDVADRCQLFVGDFFDARTIPSFKYYCIRWCLHDWPDEDAVAILKSVRKAIVESPESRFILVEMVISEGHKGNAARYADVAMMVACSGRQRSREEWASLAERAGWRLEKETALRNTWASAIELRPVEKEGGVDHQGKGVIFSVTR